MKLLETTKAVEKATGQWVDIVAPDGAQGGCWTANGAGHMLLENPDNWEDEIRLIYEDNTLELDLHETSLRLMDENKNDPQYFKSYEIQREFLLDNDEKYETLT